MKLSVFRGGFTREAAAEVAGANLRVLMSLLNKSLIRRDADSGRYEIHELLRQFAENNLSASSIKNEMHDTHARYYLLLVEKAAPYFRSSQFQYWYEVTESEYDNIRQSLEWVVTNSNIEWATRFAIALMDFWYYQTYHLEALSWLVQIEPLAENANAILRGKFYIVHGLIHFVTQNVQENNRYQELAVVTLRTTYDEIALGWALTMLAGGVGLHEERYEEAPALYNEALSIFEKLNDSVALAQLYGVIGVTREYVQDYKQAAVAFEKSLNLSRKIGETRRVVIMTNNLAGLAYRSGEYSEAFYLYRDAIKVAHSINFNYFAIMCIGLIAGSLLKLGLYLDALILWSLHRQLTQSYGIVFQPAKKNMLPDMESELRAVLESNSYNAGREKGEQMSIDKGVAYLLDIDESLISSG